MKERPGVTGGEINVEYVDIALIALTRQFQRLCRLAHSTFKTAGRTARGLDSFQSYGRNSGPTLSTRLGQFSVIRPKLGSDTEHEA